MLRLPALLLTTVVALLLSACATQTVRDTEPRMEPRTDMDASQAERRAATRIELAAGYFARGQHNVALDEIKQALQLQPNSREALNLRALVLDEARRNGSELPVTALVDQFYAEVQKMGGGRWDTSSLIKRL